MTKPKKKLGPVGLQKRMKAIEECSIVVFDDGETYQQSLDAQVAILTSHALERIEEGAYPKHDGIGTVGTGTIDVISVRTLVRFWVQHHPRDLDPDRATWDKKFAAFASRAAR